MSGTSPAPSSQSTVQGILAARDELLTQVAALDKRRKDLLYQVQTLKASVQVIDPSARTPLTRQNKAPMIIAEPAVVGDVARDVLRTLRLKQSAVTVPEITTVIMAERGISEADRINRQALRHAIGLYLRKQRLKGSRSVVRRIDGINGERLPNGRSGSSRRCGRCSAICLEA